MKLKEFKKYSLEIITGIAICIIYFFLRLGRIFTVPIFTDEAIYTRWAQIAKQDSAERFISLTDGKQPLFIWIDGIFMRFIHDPLLSGRLVSVLAGFLTMIGLYFLAKELFKKNWIGIIAMFVYMVSPFALVYDRMALYDSLVGTFYIWSLYLGVMLIRERKLDLAFILGGVLGLGALNKSIGLYSMYLLPVTLLLSNFKNRHRWRSIASWSVYVVIAAVIAELIYAILRLSPWFYIIKQKDATFFYPLSDLFHKSISFWFVNFIGNFHGLISWVTPYVTWPLLVLVFAAFIFYKEYWREKLLLFLYFIIPLFGFAMIAKVMYPRYLFFMVLPLFPLIAYSFSKIFERLQNIYVFISAVIVIVSLALLADFYILTDFAHAPIPQPDLGQYVNDWPAGGGVTEAIAFFQKQSQEQNIYVGTEGTFGLLPYAFEIYLKDNPHVTVQGFWPIKDNPPSEVTKASKTMPTYVVFYQPCPSCQTSGTGPITWPMHLITKIPKGIGKTYLSIYQINK